MNELTKVCFKCLEEKTLDNFYKHKQMSLGVVNKCKECNKKDVRVHYKKISTDFDFILKERERSKEKYHRLNYKEQQKIWDKDKPWKNKAKCKNLRRKYRHLPKNIHLHHWNYNDAFLEDIITLDNFEHRRAHNIIKLDLDLRVYRALDGVLLDTKEKHINFLIENNIKLYK